MNQKTALQLLSDLPREAQQEVLDFIEFLQSRHARLPRRKNSRRQQRLRGEAFIGIWRNREDLRDSTRWVRSLREREW